MERTELASFLNNDDYDQWVDNKLKISEQDDSEGMPHDEFMAKIEAMIVKAEKKQTFYNK